MIKNRHNHLFFLIDSLLIYITFHYIALQIWDEYSFQFQLQTSITTFILNIIICSCLIYSTCRKTGHFYIFWMLLTIGSFFYFIGDTIVMYQHLILQNYNTVVDVSDVFYLFFLLFYTLAFFYKIMYECNNWEKIFMLCDVCIIVTAAFTLHYYIFLKNAVHSNAVSHVFTFIKLVYPVTDLLFLVIAMSLLFRSLSFLSKSSITLLSSSLILYALLDSMYEYIKYFATNHSLFTIAPFFQIVLGLVAIACLLPEQKQKKSKQVLLTPKMGEKIRLSLPYLSVAALILFTLYEKALSPILEKGIFVTVFFVLLRHMLVRHQNKQLLQKQKLFNLELEKQIELRTEDLVKQTNALYTSQQMFKSLYEHHPDPIFTLDLHGKFLNVNNAGITLLGYQTDALLHESYQSLVYEKDLEKVIDAFHYVKEGHSTSLEIRAYHHNRDIYYLHVTVVPIILQGTITGIYLMIKDITEGKRQQEQINFLAYHDTLTQLANRRAFEVQMDNAILHAKKENIKFAIMFLDLDRFKIINDTLGHKTGDLLLIEVAKRLQHTVGQNGRVARLAGDEFTVLIKKYKNISEIESIANDILQIMNEPIEIENHTLQITPSIGIATYPEAGDNAMSLLQHADMAMYETKNKGKNGISIYTDALYEKMERKSRLEKDLPRALANEEFFLVYQPQIDITSQKIVGTEALIRWNHPEFGVISPSEFIPIIEETPQIIPIGRWALKRACQQMKICHTLGYTSLKMSVNLSAKEFQQEDLIERILTILEETNLPPEFLTLELTERIAMMDEKETLMKLRQLKENGIHTSIDDFGTGYSSLAYLSLFPIDILKIPREFTQMAEYREEEKAIVSTILSLANTLRLSVVAEGIETPEQLHFLQKHGCEYMQGYYFSEPLNGREFLHFLKNHYTS